MATDRVQSHAVPNSAGRRIASSAGLVLRSSLTAGLLCSTLAPIPAQDWFRRAYKQ